MPQRSGKANCSKHSDVFKPLQLLGTKSTFLPANIPEPSAHIAKPTTTVKPNHHEKKNLALAIVYRYAMLVPLPTEQNKRDTHVSLHLKLSLYLVQIDHSPSRAARTLVRARGGRAPRPGIDLLE
ncbi:unnamed protein product [Colias eurytheme]|nr:unnamed protein product [Colias eurytheme]